MKRLTAILLVSTMWCGFAKADPRPGWYVPPEDKVESHYLFRPYFEGSAGGSFLSENVSPNKVYGFRAGTVWRELDLSVGYLNNTNGSIKPMQGGLANGEVDLHTANAEMYFSAPLHHFLTVKAGFGVGYTFANDLAFKGSAFKVGEQTQTTLSERLDGGVSYTIGTALEREILRGVCLGLSLKYFLFPTTRIRSVAVQEDEGTEVYESRSQVNLNALLLNLGIRWSF